MNKPKISIVTPNYNGEKYLEETILSIINQNYPNLEYIIIDGGSSDGSIDIIKKYESKLSYWVSESDKGMYDALQKGFAKSTGEIMGWINSDDMLHPRSLFSIVEIFDLPNVKWLQGLPTCFDEKGRTINISNKRNWSKYQFWRGNYQWIQQESTFWKRELWDKGGRYISNNLKLAGDLELWNRFFKYEKLYTPNCLIGGFRIRSRDQLSLNFIDKYLQEAEEILKNNEYDNETKAVMKKISKFENFKTILQRSIIFNQSGIIYRINKKIEQANQFPPSIHFNRLEQKFLID